MINRRSFFRSAAAAFAGTAFITTPFLSPSYDPKMNREPNPYQLAFIKTMALQNDYIGFGDTDHRRPGIHEFCLHPAIIGALAQADINTFFLEWTPEDKALFSPDMPRAEFIEKCADNLISGWICDPRAKKLACEALDGAITARENFSLVPVDQRFASSGNEPLPFNTAQPVRSVLLIPFHLARKVAKNVFGCNDEKVFIPAFPVLILGKDKITNDQNTFAAMTQLKERGAILYGAAHFERSNTKNSMRHLFENAGKKLCVMNVYEHIRNCDMPTRDSIDAPQATLFIQKPSERYFREPQSERALLAIKTGILAGDDATLALLAKSVREVDARESLLPLQPQDFTAG